MRYHFLNHKKERQNEEYRRIDLGFSITFQLKAIKFDTFSIFWDFLTLQILFSLDFYNW